MTLPGSDNNSFWPGHSLVLKFRAGSGGESKSSSCFGVVLAVLVQRVEFVPSKNMFLNVSPLMMQLVESPSEL